MIIAKDSAVKIHFKLTNHEGETLDSSEGEEPMAYLHGAKNIISGLEAALEGKQKGDKVNVTLEPENAYGDIHPELIQQVPRSAFQGVDSITVGQRFETQDQNGHPQIVVVQEVNDETVTINANHLLAGQTLTFDVTVEDVREATADEIAHGHIHSASCNH